MKISSPINKKGIVLLIVLRLFGNHLLSAKFLISATQLTALFSLILKGSVCHMTITHLRSFNAT